MFYHAYVNSKLRLYNNIGRFCRWRAVVACCRRPYKVSLSLVIEALNSLLWSSLIGQIRKELVCVCSPAKKNPILITVREEACQYFILRFSWQWTCLLESENNKSAFRQGIYPNNPLYIDNSYISDAGVFLQEGCFDVLLAHSIGVHFLLYTYNYKRNHTLEQRCQKQLHFGNLTFFSIQIKFYLFTCYIITLRHKQQTATRIFNAFVNYPLQTSDTSSSSVIPIFDAQSSKELLCNFHTVHGDGYSMKKSMMELEGVLTIPQRSNVIFLRGTKFSESRSMQGIL